MKLNKETQEVLSDGDQLSLMIKGTGWAIARKRLIDQVMDLQSIRNINEAEPEKMMLDIKARNTAVDILIDWLKDIEGSAEQFKNNFGESDKEREEIVLRFGDS